MTPRFPYYAVIFTSVRSGEDPEYDRMARFMEDLAARQPGFLGMEHARQEVGITVSYWQSLQDIAAWKAQADHQLAQQAGRDKWYTGYRVRICRVEKEYTFGDIRNPK